MTDTAAGTTLAQDEAGLAQAIQAERERQAGWRLEARATTARLIDETDVCMEGAQRWLQEHGIPQLHGEEPENAERGLNEAREQALQLIPSAPEPLEHYSAAGLRVQLARLQREGQAWLTGFARDARTARRQEDFPESYLTELFEKLGGSAPAVPRVHLGVGVTLDFSIPLGNLPIHVSDDQIQRVTEQRVREALTALVRHSQFGAELDDGGLDDIQVTVTRDGS